MHKYHKTLKRNSDFNISWQARRLQTTWQTDRLLFFFKGFRQKRDLKERTALALSEIFGGGGGGVPYPLQVSNCCLQWDIYCRKWISDQQTGCIFTVIHSQKIIMAPSGVSSRACKCGNVFRKFPLRWGMREGESREEQHGGRLAQRTSKRIVCRRNIKMCFHTSFLHLLNKFQAHKKTNQVIR